MPPLPPRASVERTPPTRTLPLAFAVFATLGACDGAPSAREEARSFLAAVTDLDTDQDPEVRHRRLLSLQQMRINSDPVREARDHCVAAHTGLMLAEAAQATARAELLAARRADTDAGLPPDVTERVSKAIRGANDQLEVAKGAFEQCRQETQALAVKFR